MRKQVFQLAAAGGREDARKERRRARQSEHYHLDGGSFQADNLMVLCLAPHGSAPAAVVQDLYTQIQQLEPSSAKVVYLEAARTLLRDNLQATWGRVQQHEEMEYERLVEAAVIAKRQRPRLTQLSGNVLEEFEGFVDQFDGEIAHVTLKTEDGETFYGQYPTAELMARGIRERRRFKCRTMETGSHVKIDLEAIPDREVSEVRERAIEEKLRELLGDDDDSEDAR